MSADAANFWVARPGTEDEYWREYETTRPVYGDSGFLDTIYAYHGRKPNTSFDVAHDVAAGAGHSSVELAQRFKHVVVSDENEGSMGAARRRLQKDGVDGQMSYVVASAEDLADQKELEDGSADLVTCAESVPMMNTPVMLENFARLLKPQGTVAVWFYGRPRFTEETHKEKCQKLYDEIMNRTFYKAINSGGPKALENWKLATGGIMSWLDYVDMGASAYWSNVERWRWNSNLASDPGFYDENAFEGELSVAPSAVRDGETRKEVNDTTFWTKTWSLAGVRKFVDYTFPNIGDSVREDAKIQELFTQLGEAMGGPEAQRSYTIACALILATRSDKKVA